MKKAIYLSLFLSILFLAYCSKNNSNMGGGSWTFKSTSYTVYACDTGFNDLLIAENNATASSSLELTFYSLPTTSRNYTIANGSSITPNEVALTLNGTGGGYESTGASGSLSVYVTVSNGKISATGSGITMTNGVDSSALSFNLRQTN